MPNAELLQSLFKQSWFGILTISQTIGKFKAIVCLNALYCIGELLYNIFEELCRGISAVFFVRLENPKTAVFINECVLEISFTFYISTKQDLGTYFTSI